MRLSPIYPDKQTEIRSISILLIQNDISPNIGDELNLVVCEQTFSRNTHK